MQNIHDVVSLDSLQASTIQRQRNKITELHNKQF